VSAEVVAVGGKLADQGLKFGIAIEFSGEEKGGVYPSLLQGTQDGLSAVGVFVAGENEGDGRRRRIASDNGTVGGNGGFCGDWEGHRKEEDCDKKIFDGHFFLEVRSWKLDLGGAGRLKRTLAARCAWVENCVARRMRG